MVGSRLTIDFMHPAAALDAIALFDHEFIVSRGRSISFAQRFDDVFALPESWVATGGVAGDLAGALVVRPFSWRDGARAWRGAMMGLVCTRPRYRGMGYAAELLAAAEMRCHALGLNFGVLWAVRDGLYGRQGWRRSDRGVLGVRRAESPATAPALRPLDAPLLTRLEVLHEARRGPRVKRTLSNYRHLLPPAEQMWALVEGESFALCGSRGRMGYVHDIAAREQDMPSLWRALSASFGELYVNVEGGSDTHLWLAANTNLEWTQQSLAMWKPLGTDSPPFASWYVPFMDRI